MSPRPPPRFIVPPLPEKDTRVIHGINGRGLWSLYLREIRRFLSIPGQSLAAPLASTLLFFIVFNTALGRGDTLLLGVNFSQFLVPSLIMMAIMQNAFANASFSLVIAKVQGNIVDIIMPPLSPFELTLGYSLGGLTRGIAVGLVTALGVMPFVDMTYQSFFYILFYGASAAVMLALLGVICGLVASKFDHLAALTNFVIVPLTFLSGAFFVTAQLPPLVETILSYSPFFWHIDGFRYGFIGASDHTPTTLSTLCLVALIDGLLFLTTWRLFHHGVGLKP
ncbi:MAG: ABC transporter permease [Alphaproteobacteria bacterium GM202ARS2]|nr:ABC transporter permease [Alphaproteobacteria bacterium GM202ARS2]